jgi:hypothetical protein
MAENRNPATAADGGSTNGFPSGTTRVELTQAGRFRQHALPSIPILANLIPAQPSGRVWGRRDLVWRRNGDDWVICHYRSTPLLRVVRDTRFREMWRIAHAGDRLSDLTNLTRARDGATSWALAILNRPAKAQETHPARSPMNFAEPLIPLHGPIPSQCTSDPFLDHSRTEGKR